jgi:large subunit ribosomal protein L4
MAETTNSFDAAAYTGNGTARERVALPPDMFDGVVNKPVLHQAVKAFLANQRQGNAATKTRGRVIGGNQKPWKQKGTGRARQGSIRAPQWVGGGTVFGPIPRSYAQFVPKQVRALARRSAFNARAREGAVIVIDAFNYDAPKTSRLAAFVDRLGVNDQKVLILTDGVKPNLHLSGRNLPTVHVLPYSDVSAYHILWSDVVVIEGGALGQTLEPIPDTEPAPREKAPKREAAAPAKKKTAAKAAAKKTVSKKSEKAPAKKKAAKPAKKEEKKSPKKAAAKKSAAKPKKKGK